MHADMMPFVERLVVAMENISCDVKTMSQHMESMSNSIKDINVNLIKKNRETSSPLPCEEAVDLVSDAPVDEMHTFMESVSGLEDWHSFPSADVLESQQSSGNTASMNLSRAHGDNLLEVELSGESFSQSSENQKSFAGTSGLSKKVNRLTGTSNYVESSCDHDKQREHSYSKDSAKCGSMHLFRKNFCESLSKYGRVLIKPLEKKFDASPDFSTKESGNDNDNGSFSEESVEVLSQLEYEDGLDNLREHEMELEQEDSRKREKNKSYTVSISSEQGGSQLKQMEPLLCEICGKRFFCNANLEVHSRVHSGKRPFKCSVCKRAFTQKGALNFHMRVHSSARPFTCTLCEKAFKRKHTLQIHMRTHTGEKPFVCKVCRRAFSEQSSIMRHMRIHTLERPFKCQACGKTFAQRCHLTTHTRIHTGERPYKCPVCGRGFACSGTLSHHLFSHSHSMTKDVP